METVSIGIQNLCAPCGCACKYCLLQSCKKAEGVDYFRGKRLAEKFVEWAREKGFSPLPFYYIAYCAEYPQLIDTIEFNKDVGFIGAKFLQCNGIKIKTLGETDDFIIKIKSAGVENIDTTFFGSREYHDSFAGRKGDYDFMLLLAERASALGLKCSPTVVITKENINMLDDLFGILNSIPGIGQIYSFLPDYRGRGYLFEQCRITAEDFESLSDNIKKTLNISRYKSQADWLSSGVLPEYTKRALIITLREDNIELLENMTCDEIVSYVEKLDDDYYKIVPSINELAKIYGDSENQQLYRLRDLFWMWQKRYIKENNIDIYNVTDERYCNTVRS